MKWWPACARGPADVGDDSAETDYTDVGVKPPERSEAGPALSPERRAKPESSGYGR